METQARTPRRLAVIVAIAKNGVIGKGGKLPWDYPEDRMFFQRMTMGHAVIMGRKTWDERGQPLPGRQNLVVSRTVRGLPGARVFPTLDLALEAAWAIDPEPFVLGGVGVIEEALPKITRIYLTEIPESPDGDTVLHLDLRGFRVESARVGEKGARFVTLLREETASPSRQSAIEKPVMPVDRTAAAAAIDAFLRAIGRDPAEEPQLVGTGARVADAFIDELCDGYGKDPRALLAAQKIESGATDVVVLRDAAVTTMCPHHLMPARGTATVGFAPRGSLVGLGALVDLVDSFAHRLILQEEIGERVAATLQEVLQPAWSGCRLVLEHGCVVHRAERRHGARAETLALRGDLSGDARATAERALGLGR